MLASTDVMSGRLKLPPKPKKSKASTKKSLDSADDFQEAADAEEETGGKWRAGDQAKSSRAFARAIEIYDQGLARHPKNFDLAYNKARLQFEVSQQPALIAHLPGDFLGQALQSHRHALSLNQENTDILFNFSQLLISLAENNDGDDSTDQPALLREALELLDKCFSLQSTRFEEQQTAWEGFSNASEGVPANTTAEPSTSESIESATVESAVVPSDLLDTLHASLTALSQLLPLANVSDLASLEQIGTSLLAKQTEILPLLSAEDSPAATQSSQLATATYNSSLATAAYSAGSLSSNTYLSSLDKAFTSLDLNNSEAACLAADALVEALAAIYSRDRTAEPLLPLLTRARELYSTATTSLDAAASPKPQKGSLSLSLGAGDRETLALAAGAREAHGDAAMLAHRLTGSGAAEALALYAAAERGYRAAGDAHAAASVAGRAGVAAVVLGEKPADGDGVRRAAREMLDEGLLEESWL